MTTGLSTVNLAHKWLDMLGGSAFTAPAGAYAQMHTADPGASGGTGLVNGTVAGDRKAVTWAAAGTPTTGRKDAVATFPSWVNWDGASAPNTLTHVSVWDSAGAGAGASSVDTGGLFLFSGQLLVSKAVGTGDTFNLTSLTISLAPLAA